MGHNNNRIDRHIYREKEKGTERGRMSKSVYVRVFHDLELLRCVLRCAIERQL